MIELQLAERKRIELSILKDLDSLCKKNSITYYLAYGSLLGTVRHSGFIPWDDDIDVWVPINEYQKLLSILKAESKYDVLDNISDVSWPMAFAKLSDPKTLIVDDQDEYKFLKQRGIAVDIFPLFYCKNNKKWFKRIHNNRNNIIRLFCFENGILAERTGLKNRLNYYYAWLMNVLGHDQDYYKKRMLKKELQLLDTGYLGCPVSLYENADIYDEDCFSETIMKEFEGDYYPVPVGYDRILTKLYGNYMQLPAPEDRVSNHKVKAYRIEDE